MNKFIILIISLLLLLIYINNSMIENFLNVNYTYLNNFKNDRKKKYIGSLPYENRINQFLNIKNRMNYTNQIIIEQTFDILKIIKKKKFNINPITVNLINLDISLLECINLSCILISKNNYKSVDSCKKKITKDFNSYNLIKILKLSMPYSQNIRNKNGTDNLIVIKQKLNYHFDNMIKNSKKVIEYVNNL